MPPKNITVLKLKNDKDINSETSIYLLSEQA